MLNTKKMEMIIEKLGGDLNEIDTNLESERLDYLMDIEVGGQIDYGISINETDDQGYATDVSIIGMTLFNSGFFSGSNALTANLKKISGNEITYLTGDAFKNLSYLEEFNFPKLQTISFDAFYGCSKLAMTSLPDSIQSIEAQAFYNCSNLALNSLPKNLETIGEEAFRGCGKLNIKTLPSKVKKTGRRAFYGCYGITELTIEASDFSELGYWTFYNCGNLTKLVMPNITALVNQVDSTTFTGTPIKNGTGYVYVPDNLVDTFKADTLWSTIADQIKGISELS